MRALALLGSTGSIGCNVLDVVRRFPGRFTIRALAAGGNVDLLRDQVLEFEPEVISLGSAKAALTLAEMLPRNLRGRITHGPEGLLAAATAPDVDMVVTAVVGAVGLEPTLAAIEAGRDIGLANKETLVMAGDLVMEAARRAGVRILPIDSEHSALFQALEAGRRQDVARLILTASGGPFRTRPAAELEQVGPEEALAHPNWDMGAKISIDSATLMNKGLEVIEACRLFDMPVDQVDVVVHPQSVVHSMVEYIDGSVVAQLGIPDMRIPIAYALSYPERLPLGLRSLSLAGAADLSFEEPDLERFPCLGLAYAACRAGGTAPAVLNAANEVAVAAFLRGMIGFTDIARIVEACLEQNNLIGRDLDTIITADHQTRQKADDLCALLPSGSLN